MTKNIVLIIFVFSLLIRLVLAFLNRGANDDHIEVVNWIIERNELPQKEDCIECYQPKFFYILSAGISKLFSLPNRGTRTVAAQLMNLVFSFFILLLFWKFIQKQTLNEKTKILLFAFFAFNPCLAGINVQATNDTLTIFCGVAAAYFADLFFRKYKINHAIILLISVIIAPLTKANGLLLFVVVSLIFIAKIFSQKERRYFLLKYFFIGLFCFFAIVPLAGGYYTNYNKYNSLTISAWNKDQTPLFFENTPIARPGVRNMFEAFFSFRYFDMIRHPVITNENDIYPLHRTSLWSQLYGRTMFLHFDQWPPLWQTQNPLILNIGRSLIVLGIIPLILFITGFFQNIFDFIKNIFQKKSLYFKESNDYFHLLIVVGYLMASVQYSYYFRDFSAMKSIYLFPGFISFIKIILDGYSFIRSEIITRIVKAILNLIVFFSIIDILFLVYQHI